MRVLMLKTHTSPDGTRHQKGSVWFFSDADAEQLIADKLAERSDPDLAAFVDANPPTSAAESTGAEHEAHQEG